MDGKTKGALALRTRREQRGLSQFALAVALDIHPQHVSMMERGLRRPGRSLALRLRDEFGVAPEWWDEAAPAVEPSTSAA